MAVTLRDVDGSNWRACIKLDLHPHQRGFVASNVATIAESKFEPHYILRAVYLDEQVVGLLAYCHETEPEDRQLYWIFRFMIDRRHQRQGIGEEAVSIALRELAALGAARIRTMHKPDNSVAATLYAKLGFRPIGVLDDGDRLLELVPGTAS